LLSTISRLLHRSDERGQVLVLFAGGITALLIIAALAFDAGMMLVERRDEQNAADAAALAGARHIIANPSEAEPAARRIALLNGYDHDAVDENVYVHIPPIHGAYSGFPGFIEVQIEATRPSIFGGIVGKASWPIGAYAVATNSQNLTFPFSMLSLDPTACKAIQVSGGGRVEAYGNIQSNSNGSDCGGAPIGFSRTGGSTINVYTDDETCRAVGEIQDAGASGTMSCTKSPNSFALPDPLQNLDPPAKPPLANPMVPVGHTLAVPDGCPGSSTPATELAPAICDPGGGSPSSTYSGKAWIMYPGLYPGGIEASHNAIVYWMPGIYWIGGGGLDIQNGASIMTITTEADAAPTTAGATWGGGVLIYNSQLPSSAGGPIKLNSSSATMKLHMFQVPSGDPDDIYNNMVIFQDRTMDLPGDDVTLNGSDSVAEVEGLIYVPSGDVKLNGDGGTLITDQIIANTFLIDGGGGTIEVLRRVGVDAIITAAGLVE
jgi:Putative Flp pilus-assembly TadE/G-like